MEPYKFISRNKQLYLDQESCWHRVKSSRFSPTWPELNCLASKDKKPDVKICSKSALTLSLGYLCSHFDQSDITIPMSDHILLFTQHIKD